ncbi:signal peptidase II [Chloroflexota bacterium]
MQESNRHHQDIRRNAVFFLTGLLIVVSDQLSKVWIRTNLESGHSLFEVGFFRIVHVSNTGAAFGMLQDQSTLLTVIGLVGVVALLIFSRISHRSFPFLGTNLGKLTLGLILGGSLGNVTDRIQLGYVTDFIDFNYWPAFNIADSAVTVGVLILAYSLLRESFNGNN